MTKSDVREFLEKAWEKGYISDEDFDSFNDGDFGINKYPGSAEEWWAKNRSKLRDVQGWIKFNKDYKKNRSFEDQIQDYVGDVDIEELGDGDIQDIADDFEVDVDRVKEGLEQLQIREMKKQLDRADKENYGTVENGKQVQKSNKQLSEEMGRAKKVVDSPILSTMANDYSVRRYIEGASAPEIAANELASKVGAAADFVPTWVPYAGQIAPFVSPTVRFIQGAVYDRDNDDYNLAQELAKAGEDAAYNYGVGLALGGGLTKKGAKLAEKATGDVASSLAGQQGRVGKIVGDVVEEKVSKKHPKIVSSIGTGVTRRKLQGASIANAIDDPKTKKVVQKVENDYDKAVKQTIDEYSKDWEKNYYVPDENDSDVMKDAYKIWSEKHKGE